MFPDSFVPQKYCVGTHFFYFHRLPHSPRRPPSSCAPGADVSTVWSLPPTFNEAASIASVSTFTSTKRGDTYVFFISDVFYFVCFCRWDIETLPQRLYRAFGNYRSETLTKPTLRNPCGVTCATRRTTICCRLYRAFGNFTLPKPFCRLQCRCREW